MRPKINTAWFAEFKYYVIMIVPGFNEALTSLLGAGSEIGDVAQNGEKKQYIGGAISNNYI